MADFSFHTSSFPWLISTIYGRFFIPLLILALAFFILLWHIFHFLPHPCPGLFHSFMAGFSFCVSSLPWIISLFCGRFFILYFIPALDYFIILWHIFHSLPHPCSGLFHFFMAHFSFLASSLPWLISFLFGKNG